MYPASLRLETHCGTNPMTDEERAFHHVWNVLTYQWYIERVFARELLRNHKLEKER
jgi:hypothetical protein